MSAAGPITQATQIAVRLLAIGLLVTIVLWLGSGSSRVGPGDWAVVTRFGAIVRDHGPGLVLAWPSPLETVHVVPGPDRQERLEVTSLGLDSARPGGAVLTGDAGIVHVDATVIYTVRDAKRWLVQQAHIEPALRRSLADAVISVCAGRRLDGVLVASVDGGGDGAQADAVAIAHREGLRRDVAERVQRSADRLGLGLIVSRVDLAVALPGRARAAFSDVVAAGNAASTEIAQARTMAERQIQEARGAADRIRAEASARARETLSQARVATEAVAALIAEPDAQRRALTIERIWRERTERILARSGGVIAVHPEAPAMALPMQ